MLVADQVDESMKNLRPKNAGAVPIRRQSHDLVDDGRGHQRQIHHRDRITGDHLMMQDKIYGHVKTNKDRTTFLEFCRYLRSLNPPSVRIAIVMDNFSPHLSTKKDDRVRVWAEANNVELAYVPINASWMSRIEAQFQALRYFTLDGTDHRSHEEQNSMIRRYIIWRNRNAQDKTLRELVKRANVA